MKTKYEVFVFPRFEILYFKYMYYIVFDFFDYFDFGNFIFQTYYEMIILLSDKFFFKYHFQNKCMKTNGCHFIPTVEMLL